MTGDSEEAFLSPVPCSLSPALTSTTCPDSAANTPGAIALPSTTKSSFLTVGNTLVFTVTKSLARNTKQRRTVSAPCCTPRTIPPSLHNIFVRATTAPGSMVSPSTTSKLVWVLPWVASAVMSRRTTKDSKITNCSLWISPSSGSVISSMSAAKGELPCSPSLSCSISNTICVRSSSTPSTDFTRSESL